MRIYQVLAIGSFVALAMGCKDESADSVSDAAQPPEAALPANDLGKEDANTAATDAGGRPAGATDPVRTPAPNP